MSTQYAKAPAPHASEAGPGSPGRPMTSGDAPQIRPRSLCEVALAVGRAIPRSIRTARSSGMIRTFDGLMSRWITPSGASVERSPWR
jgi:hypothetical protein